MRRYLGVLGSLLTATLAASCGQSYADATPSGSAADAGTVVEPPATDAGTGAPDAEAGSDAAPACDYDCHGGACVNGLCQPTTIASGLERPYAIAADGSGVYFTDLGPVTGVAGSLQACEGPPPCTPVVLRGSLDNPRSVAINATEVVVSQWTAAQGAVVSAAVWGFSRATRVLMPAFPVGAYAARGVAADATHVWVVDNGVAGGNGDVFRLLRNANQYNFDQYTLATSANLRPELVTVMGAPNGGVRELYTASDALFEKGVPSALLQGQTFVDLVNDGAGVYWINVKQSPYHVWGCPTGASQGCVDLVAAPTASGLAADATGLYWVEQGATSKSGRLVHLAKGGAPKELLTNLELPQKLALTTNDVYITVAGTAGAKNGAVLRVARR